MQILSDESFRKRSATTVYDPSFIANIAKIQRIWRQIQCKKLLKKRIKKMKSKTQIAKELLTS